MFLLIGSYSSAEQPGIHIYKWEASLETFIPTGHIAGITNPSYLSLSEQEANIYAITENKEGSASALHIYHLKEDGSQVIPAGGILFQGAGSCYISTDAATRHAFVANYGEGTVTVLQLTQKDAAGIAIQELRFSGNGPDPERQDQPHLHAALLSNDEQHLYCTDLGSDRLYRFPYKADAEKPIDEQSRLSIQLPPGCGPRHLAFSPDGRFLYLITELSAEIYVFDISGSPDTWLQRLTLTQEGYSGKLEGGDIQIDKGGHFLYASNRGDANEIIVFKIEPLSGNLVFLQRIGAAGLSPRSLLICEQQGLLLAANEQSNNVSIFKIMPNGSLEFTKAPLEISAPTCLKNIEIQ